MPTVQPGASVDPAAFSAMRSARQDATSADQLAGERVAGTSDQQAAAQRAKTAGQQFEAMFLRQMLEEFLPKDSEVNFGGGTAGPVWRSMLADSMATTMSRSGSLGLSQLVMNHEAKTKVEAQ